MKKLSISGHFARNQRSEMSDAINLMARKARANDLADCHALHKSLGVPYAEASWRILPDMWRAMLLKGTMKLFLVEDRASPLGSRIVSRTPLPVQFRVSVEKGIITLTVVNSGKVMGRTTTNTR